MDYQARKRQRENKYILVSEGSQSEKGYTIWYDFITCHSGKGKNIETVKRSGVAGIKRKERMKRLNTEGFWVSGFTVLD